MSYENVEACMKAAMEQADALRKAYADGDLVEYLDEEFMRENLCKAIYDLNGFTDFELDNLNGLTISYQHIDVKGVDGSHYEYYMGMTDGDDKELMNEIFDYLSWTFECRLVLNHGKDKYGKGY